MTAETSVIEDTRLRCVNVSLTYEGALQPVVKNLSLSIPDHQVTSIIGPNGCGKSTLLRALGRLMRPQQGLVVLDGQLIHRYPSKEVARRLGLLSQQAVAPEAITVEDLVGRGRYPHQGFFQPPSRADQDAVTWAIELAGMQDLRRQEVDKLSGGQRQRAWIAMALAQETDLLLLDEPTTYLDLAHQRDVMDLIALLHNEGKTVLMVLHDINEAAAASQHMVAMSDGVIRSSGTPGEVITESLLGELYGVDCDVMSHPGTGHPVCVPRSADRDWSERQSPADPEGRKGIQVRGLSTGYPTRTISQELVAHMPAGRITSIVGPNGCGKSTLLSTGSRILPALAGSFMIEEVDTAKGSRRSLAKRLASVRQGPPTPSGFLVEDLVAAGRFPHQNFHRQWSRQDNDKVSEALRLCHLEDLRYREVESLSGGQRQRAWIAMALAQDARYLFLDEPTTFLDIGHQIEVLDLVIELNRKHGHTVVMVLHDLNLAARYSDRVIVMKDGKIVATGPPSVVIHRETIREVFAVDGHLEPDRRTGRPLFFTGQGGPPAPSSHNGLLAPMNNLLEDQEVRQRGKSPSHAEARP